MSILCPACSAQIPADSRACPQCAVPLEAGRLSGARRVAVLFGRLLILLTLVINIIGWVGCSLGVDPAEMVGLLNGLLGLVLVVVGLIGRYRWSWSIGLGHLALPFVMFAMIDWFNMGPLWARPALFLWVDAVFLAVIVPASIIGCYRGATSGEFKHPSLCRACGYPLHGLTEPRCPECGTPFDVRKLIRLSSHLPVRMEAERPDAPGGSGTGGPGSS
jgi:hypothetical protein